LNLRTRIESGFIQGLKMNTKYLAALALLGCISFTTEADPMRYPYWQMIKDVVNSVESQPPRPTSITENNHKTNVEYPFELLRHLRPTDLLRAASEGAQEARLQAALGKPPAEIDALVRCNVALALEYLPMLVRSDKDLEEIALIIAKREEDKVLRLYLLQNTFPGHAPPSFLSLTLPDIIRSNDEAFKKWIHHVATHPKEDPVLQSLALRISFERLMQQYEYHLQNDPAALELQTTTDTVDLIALAKNTPNLFSEDTRNLLKNCRRDFHDFAFAIAGHIAEGSVRDAEVQTITRQILESMRDTISGISVEVINTFLAGKPYVSNPFPTLPSEKDDQEELEKPGKPQELKEFFEQNSGQE
jgi:hypothetical protein